MSNQEINQLSQIIPKIKQPGRFKKKKQITSVLYYQLVH